MASEQFGAEDKSISTSSFQLDPDQTLKAATALLGHIKKEHEKRSVGSSKKDLLAETAASSDDDADLDEDGDPVWLVLTTKKFIVDKTRLKPGKIPLPHPIYSSQASSVCLFTCDPTTPYKEILQHPSFPPSLSRRITQTIPIAKLRTQYKPFENRRQLLAQHDLFFADDRIVTYLPSLLGKTFYKSGSKRPIPVNLSPRPERIDGKTVKKDKKHALTPHKERGPAQVATPADAARELEKALRSTTVQLSPSTSTSIRVGRCGKAWTSEMIKENIEVAVEQLVEKWVPAKWKGLRALYIKGETTASLPIWMTKELWEKEGDVLDRQKEIEDQNGDEYGGKEEGDQIGGTEVGGKQDEDKNNKRKADKEEQRGAKKRNKKANKEADIGISGAISMKQKLAKQKKAVMADLGA